MTYWSLMDSGPSNPKPAHIPLVRLRRQYFLPRRGQHPFGALLLDQRQRGEFFAHWIVRQLRAAVAQALQAFALGGGQDQVGGGGHAVSFFKCRRALRPTPDPSREREGSLLLRRDPRRAEHVRFACAVVDRDGFARLHPLAVVEA